MTRIDYPNETYNTFTYNGPDTRVSKVDSTGTRTYLRDGAGVTAPVLSDGAASYTPGISEKRSGTTTYSHSGFKNGESQTGSGQTVLATKTFDAFGNLDTSSGTWKGPFGYGGPHGYQSDPDSGLMLLGHRHYDPSTGRFLTRDLLKDGRNWYNYCSNNPTSFADPTGNSRFVLYVLLDIYGEVVKWGKTTLGRRRYTKKYLRDNEYTFQEVAEYNSNREVLDGEREMVEISPGPLNKEPWAGVKQAVEALDPTPIGLGMTIANGLEGIVAPYVQNAQNARQKGLDWWLEESGGDSTPAPMPMPSPQPSPGPTLRPSPTPPKPKEPTKPIIVTPGQGHIFDPFRGLFG